MERSHRLRVAVVGLGSVGSMVLWRLAASGVLATGYEQFGAGHDRGAAGGESRIFHRVDGDPSYVPLLRTARSLWHELEADSGHQLLTTNGALAIGLPGTAPMAAMRKSADAYDLTLDELDGADLRRRFPAHVVDGEVGQLDPQGGYLRPELAVIAAVSRARGLGATVHTHTSVEAIETTSMGVTVRTADGCGRFDHVVVTTGPWAQRLLPQVAGLVELRRPVQAWFAATDHAAFDPKRFPVFRRYGPTPCYGLPSLDGLGVKLGLTAAQNRPVGDPDQLDRTVSVTELHTFRERVARVLHGVYPDPYRVGAYAEGYTRDGHALVGALPGTTGRISVLVGFSGSGFKFAATMGEIGADLAVHGRSDATPEAMRLDRFFGDREHST